MQRVKIVFEIEQDADGYPPVRVESVWAIDRGGGRFEIDNIPWFVKVATVGDVVGVERRDSELVFAEMLEQSSNSLIRILCARHVDPQAVRADLSALGCESEYDGDHNLVALSMPASAPADDVWQYLDSREASGDLEFEVPIHRQETDD